MNDDLVQFADYWFSNKPMITIADNHTIHDGNIMGAVLYREKEYQVQLFICMPNSSIKPHKHPNIDALVIPHGGGIEFTVEGTLYCPECCEPCNTGRYGVRVGPNQMHHAEIGSEGGSFIVIQKWLNGVTPTSVGNDWEDNEGNTHGVCLPNNEVL